MSKRKVKSYTLEFKQSSAKLAATTDQPISQTAEEIGVSSTTLYGWVKKYQPDSVPTQPEENHLSEELKRLRKENIRLRQERDILKKAVAYFANETT
jgi:transposase